MTSATSMFLFVLIKTLLKRFQLLRTLLWTGLSGDVSGFSARTTPAGFCHFSKDEIFGIFLNLILNVCCNSNLINLESIILAITQ
jgi:hypothetical protein